MQDISQIIRAETGAPFGFCPFSEVSEHLLECRAKNRIPKGAKTVICFAFPYKVTEKAPRNISRYAAVPDYHNICGEMLSEVAEKLKLAYPANEFACFVDNSPIPEVWAAARAGLGVIGKNGLLITKRYGSFVFLGEIVTDLDIPAVSAEVSACAECGKCFAVCPVGLCKEGCLSAVTQKKKPLSEREVRLIKKNGTVWGCDVCQNACPLNRTAELTDIPTFLEGYRDRYRPHEDIAGRAFEWRGEGVVLRNALMLDEVAQVVPADTAADETQKQIKNS